MPGHEYGKRYVEIFKGSGIVLFGTLAGYVLTYLFKMINGRYFGPSGLGILAIGISTMTVLSSLSVLGLNEGVGRFIPFFQEKKDYAGTRAILTFGATLSLAMALLVSIAVFINAPRLAHDFFKNPATEGILRLFSIVIPFQAFFIFSTGVMRGMKKMASIAIGKDILTWGVKILAALVVISMALPVEYIAAAFYCALPLSVLYFFYIFKKDALYREIKQVKPRKGARLEFFKFSMPLIFSNLAQLLRKQTDVLVIGFFLPASAVGLYYAALPFAMTLTLFLFSINRILLPVASEIIGQGEIKYARQLFKDFALLSFQMTLPLFLFIFIFADDIILIVYGKEFIQAGLLLKILCAGFFINSISGSFGEFFKAFNKSYLVLYLSLGGGLLNILLMLFLVPKWGIKGAALSATLSLVFMVLLGLVLSQLILKINPFGTRYFIMIAAAVLGCILFSVIENYFNRLLLLALFLVFASVYGLFIFKSNAFFVGLLKAKRNVFHEKKVDTH